MLVGNEPKLKSEHPLSERSLGSRCVLVRRVAAGSCSQRSTREISESSTLPLPRLESKSPRASVILITGRVARNSLPHCCCLSDHALYGPGDFTIIRLLPAIWGPSCAIGPARRTGTCDLRIFHFSQVRVCFLVKYQPLKLMSNIKCVFNLFLVNHVAFFLFKVFLTIIIIIIS